MDGTVRVAAIYSVGLHDVSRNVQRFMSLYPEARVQLECLHPHKVVEAVVQGEADVGIMSYPPADRALAIVPLRSEPMALRVATRTIAWRGGGSWCPPTSTARRSSRSTPA